MLKHPQAIKSTPLRKSIATVSQILDLKENEVEWLARHMGHDLNIHKQYYRLQDHTLFIKGIEYPQDCRQEVYAMITKWWHFQTVRIIPLVLKIIMIKIVDALKD